MFEDKAATLVRETAEETLERIRRDRQRVSARVGRLLVRIEEQLLDPDLNVESLRRWCGHRDNNISTRFAEELGLGPWSYINQCRMEIGGRMLAASKIAVWRIGTAVGYDSGKSFSRAFKSWSGQNPSQFRRAAQAAKGEPPRVPSPTEPLGSEAISRALVGDLPAGEAEDLVDRLGDVQDRIRANYPTLSAPVHGSESVEPLMAHNLWRWIEPLPFAVQKAAIESQASAFHTPVLFHRLCTESIEAGGDGARALEMASLAVASVVPLAKRLGAAARNWVARAQVITGFAYCRVGELDEAARAFAIATRMLDHLEDEAHPLVVLELFLYQATFEMVREDYQAAGDLLETATGIHDALLARLKDQAAADG